MKVKEPIRANEFKNEDLESLKKSCGRTPTMKLILAWYADQGEERTIKFCRRLANFLLTQNASKIEAARSAIIDEIPSPPKPKHLRELAEKYDVVFSRITSEQFIADLKIEKPELWSNAGRLQFVLGPSDHAMMKALASAMNVSERNIAPLCIRALALANYRGQINLAEINPQAKFLTSSDIDTLVKSLNSIVG